MWGARESRGRCWENSKSEVNFRNWDILLEENPFLPSFLPFLPWGKQCNGFFSPTQHPPLLCLYSFSLPLPFSRSPVLGDLTGSEAYVFIKTAVKSGMWKGLEKEGRKNKGERECGRTSKGLRQASRRSRKSKQELGEQKLGSGENSALISALLFSLSRAFSLFFLPLVITVRDILEKSYCPRKTRFRCLNKSARCTWSLKFVFERCRG